MMVIGHIYKTVPWKVRGAGWFGAVVAGGGAGDSYGPGDWRHL